MKDLIQKLVNIPGTSGHEALVRQFIQDEIKSCVDEYFIDPLGNLIVRKGERKAGGKRIMVAAHMDEIGIVVTHIDSNGFIRFTHSGGLRLRYLPGQHIRFINGTMGIIGVEIKPGQKEFPPLEAMYIDIGATSAANCPVSVGDAAVFDAPVHFFGNRLVSKALDDRVGVTILIQALQQLKDSPNEVFAVFSVQEEFQMQGARTAAYAIQPDIGLAIDTTHTGDTPDARRMEVSLGKGPAIKIRDSGHISDPRIVRWMTDTAASLRIAYQREILENGTTDSSMISISRTGVPSGCMSIPTRYIHSPVEMVDWNDVENGLLLLQDLLQKKIAL